MVMPICSLCSLCPEQQQLEFVPAQQRRGHKQRGKSSEPPALNQELQLCQGFFERHKGAWTKHGHNTARTWLKHG